MIESIPLYLRTVSYLRFKQITRRGWNLVRPYLLRALYSGDRVLPRGSIPFEPLISTIPFIPHSWSRAEDVRNLRFRFLNEEISFDGQIGWVTGKAGRLWRYNLHYFDYLNCEGGLDPGLAFELVKDWVLHVPPGTPDAWDPFPVSLRLVNWIKYLGAVGPPAGFTTQTFGGGKKKAVGPPAILATQTSGGGSRAGGLSGVVPREMIRSCYLQTLWLERSLEYHLMGNHLFKNAKALLFCGLFFRDAGSSRWLAKGTKILEDQLDEQILPDGGHFERSPMYHSMIFEDCLDLLNVCSKYPGRGLERLTSRLREVVPSMLRFLLAMTHPDGRIALFNDAAFGIEAPTDRLARYCEAVGPPAVFATETSGGVARTVGPSCGTSGGPSVTAFPESGYFVMAPREGDRLIADCGQIGPDYQPGHAHSDTLSFELSIGGWRVIVDSGCSQYEDGEIRRYNRGNAGHNTITIDGINQSEVWGAHRCGRRARPLYAEISCGKGGGTAGRDRHSNLRQRREDGIIEFRGAHDGYARLPGKPIHHRRIVWSDCILIEDLVEGAGNHEIDSRMHINPDLCVDLDENRAVLSCEGKVLANVSIQGDGLMEQLTGWYCPEFGVVKKCTVLRVLFPGASLPFKTGWKIVPESD